MKIQNQIEVAAPPDELFDVLSDVERVAPLLPGASLERKEDDDTYAGTVKVKVGPITVSYRGTIYFQELDRDARRAVMRASGSEINGQGSTEATITATVTGSDSESVLTMDTDMEVRGKVAQFGRGAIGNVSGRILDQFARNLEAQVLSGDGSENGTSGRPSQHGQSAGTDTASEASGASAAQPVSSPAEDESLNMLSVVGLPMLRQAAPGIIGLLAGIAIGALVASRRRRHGDWGPAPGPMGYGPPPMGYGPAYPPTQWYWNPPGQGRGGSD
jgi:carbon monoxide dehydrogenase subunit G